ncbi:MAG: hypothetical protein ACREBD_29555, partial [Blastocatellia bacterium]
APIDGTKFCRSCGTNVSLVPQALSGQLPAQVVVEEEGRERRRNRDKRPPSIEKAASSFFTGLGFVLVALAARRFAPAGEIWWFWMLIPAFALIGEGVGQYLRLKEQQRQQQSLNQPINSPANYQAPIHAPAQVHTLSAPTTSELTPPSSVTEQTTRHLESSRQRE